MSLYIYSTKCLHIQLVSVSSAVNVSVQWACSSLFYIFVLYKSRTVPCSFHDGLFMFIPAKKISQPCTINGTGNGKRKRGKGRNLR